MQGAVTADQVHAHVVAAAGGHMAQGRHGGVDQPRAQTAEADGARGTGAAWRRRRVACQGCESGKEIRVQWRSDGADHLRARGCDNNRGTSCNDGPLAPTSCVPGTMGEGGLRQQPRHNVRRRPVGADQLRAQDVEAIGYMV
eukprot:jgi/Tetstr1/456915/TSEL_043585.t1